MPLHSKLSATIVSAGFLALIAIPNSANAQRRRHGHSTTTTTTATAQTPPATATTPATAEPIAAPPTQSPADRLVDAGIAAREQGHDDEALTLFRQAWELDHGARARAQMGFAEQALGHWVEAEQYVEEALATTDPWVERNRAAVERSLATIRQNVGTLELRGGRAGAQIFINERPMGTMPLTRALHLRTGQTQLRVQAEGFAAFTRTIEVRAGVLSREEVELVPATTQSQQQGPQQNNNPNVVVSPPPPRTGMSPAIGGAVLGVGVAAVAAGVAMNVLREQQIAHWNDDSMCLSLSPVNGMLPTRMDTCGPALIAGNTYGAIAIVSYAVGGAALVTGGILLGVSLSGRSAERSAASHARTNVQCTPWLNGAGMSCGGTF